MKLTSFRLKDQVHLMDLLEVGLIDSSWGDRFPAPPGCAAESTDRDSRARSVNSSISIEQFGVFSLPVGGVCVCSRLL